MAGAQRPKMPFGQSILPVLPLVLSIVIAICSALRSRYPVGDGSAAIVRSMLLKSRRVR